MSGSGEVSRQAGSEAVDQPVQQPMIVERQRPGIPLATLMLAIGVCAVLAVLLKPLDWTEPDGAIRRIPPEMLFAGGVYGGILAVIVAVYHSVSFWTGVASYFAGAGAVAVAIRLLIAPHDGRVALAGSALLLLFGLTVRWAHRASSID